MDWKPSVRAGPMPRDVIEAIYAADQEIYPASLTVDRLQAWVDAAPELNLCFYADPDGTPSSSVARGDTASTLVGSVIALPVRVAKWRDLLEGRLKETQVEAGDLLSDTDGAGLAANEQSIGLHIFHVERNEDHANGVKLRGFAPFVMDTVLSAARQKGLHVVGASALTATEDGERAFARLGFEPTGYEELWVQPAGEPTAPPVLLERKAGDTPAEPPLNSRVVCHAKMTKRSYDL